MKLTDRQILVLASLLGGLTMYVVYRASAVFLPLLLAFILAYLLDPLVERLQTWGWGRGLAIMTVFISGLVVASVSLILVVQSLGNEFQNVQLNLPAYARSIYDVIPLAVKSRLGIETPERLSAQFALLLEGARGISFSVIREALSVVQRAFTSTLSVVLGILGYLITPLYLYYFLKDLPALRGRAGEFVPPRYQGWFLDFLARVDTILSGFIRGQLVVCAILAVLYSLGLVIIGIDLALLIGTFAGLAFIIPYVGTVIGIILSVIMALLKFQDLLHPLLCVGWFAIVQAIEGAFITPRVVGDKVGLHPVVAVVALLLGGQFGGILGMLLAIPLAAIIKVLLVDLLAAYRQSPYFTREA